MKNLCHKKFQCVFFGIKQSIIWFENQRNTLILIPDTRDTVKVFTIFLAQNGRLPIQIKLFSRHNNDSKLLSDLQCWIPTVWIMSIFPLTRSLTRCPTQSPKVWKRLINTYINNLTITDVFVLSKWHLHSFRSSSLLITSSIPLWLKNSLLFPESVLTISSQSEIFTPDSLKFSELFSKSF